jgi:uncharacterized protein YbbC (DUF1343 family)
LPPAQITLGNEVFLRDRRHELDGRRVGIVTNQTGVTSHLESIVDAVRRDREIALRAVFAPEHGFRGDHPAGASVGSFLDPSTNLPVYSLYGATRRPSHAMLADVDVLLFDIQDVGSRAYTYISTLAQVMQAARTTDKEVWVLDRPNPLGDLVEGPVLDPHFSSFIGLYPIAMRHGMTIGELALLFNEHFGIGCRLKVIPMEGYVNTMLWPQTGLHWVQSSPNMPQWITALFYVGTGLLDNAGVNNGIGTTLPFQLAGASGIDANHLAAILNARDVPGIFFRPTYWSPLFGFWLGKTLGGVELVAADPAQARPVRAAVEILCAVRALAPRDIVIHDSALDRDWGTDTLRTALVQGESPDQIEERWAANTERFRRLRRPYQLYPAVAPRTPAPSRNPASS